MTKAPRAKKPKAQEDPEQSKRFLDLASELEAAGELNPTGGEERLDRLLAKTAPERRRRKD